MPRTLRTLVVVALIALVPVRAMAGTTLGPCLSGHDEGAAASQAHHGHSEGALSQRDGDDSAKTVAPHDHCSTAAFAPSETRGVQLQPIAGDSIEFAARAAPAFVPEKLDRPPLA